ncbi:MAG: hypothetical protein AB1631_01030 [Acidobacteriota bacterium]
MAAEYYLIVLILILAPLAYFVPRIVGNWLKYRGTRVVTCPETHRPVAVEVDSLHAGLTALAGEPDLRLRDCTRWPERRNCGQECLLEIELAPEDCLARNILTNWYAGKKCVYCGKPFDEINWAAHKPALMGADRKTLEWSDIPPETIPDVLKTHLPVCWNCHVAETFRREHPDMVVDREVHPLAKQ